MRTEFYNLSLPEIEELDKSRFDDEEDDILQQMLYTQHHVEFVYSKQLGGEIYVTLQ